MNILMGTLVACMDELKAEEQAESTVADMEGAVLSAAEEEKMILGWMGELWGQIDDLVEEETQEQLEARQRQETWELRETLALAALLQNQVEEEILPDLKVEVGFPDMVTMPRPGSRRPAFSFYRLGGGWSLAPAPNMVRLDMSVPRN